MKKNNVNIIWSSITLRPGKETLNLLTGMLSVVSVKKTLMDSRLLRVMSIPHLFI